MNKRNKRLNFGERIVGNMQYGIDLLHQFFRINTCSVGKNSYHIIFRRNRKYNGPEPAIGTGMVYCFCRIFFTYEPTIPVRELIGCVYGELRGTYFLYDAFGCCWRVLQEPPPTQVVVDGCVDAAIAFSRKKDGFIGIQFGKYLFAAVIIIAISAFVNGFSHLQYSRMQHG